MRKVDRMYLPPMQCAVCRHGKAAVDTGKKFPPTAGTLRNARVYVCTECVGTLAKTLGYFSPEQVEDMRREVELAATAKDRVDAANRIADEAKQLRELLDEWNASTEV